MIQSVNARASNEWLNDTAFTRLWPCPPACRVTSGTPIATFGRFGASRSWRRCGQVQPAGCGHQADTRTSNPARARYAPSRNFGFNGRGHFSDWQL